MTSLHSLYLLYKLLQTTCHSYLRLLQKLFLPGEAHLCRLAVNILLSGYLFPHVCEELFKSIFNILADNKNYFVKTYFDCIMDRISHDN